MNNFLLTVPTIVYLSDNGATISITVVELMYLAHSALHSLGSNFASSVCPFGKPNNGMSIAKYIYLDHQNYAVRWLITTHLFGLRFARSVCNQRACCQERDCNTGNGMLMLFVILRNATAGAGFAMSVISYAMTAQKVVNTLWTLMDTQSQTKLEWRFLRHRTSYNYWTTWTHLQATSQFWQVHHLGSFQKVFAKLSKRSHQDMCDWSWLHVRRRDPVARIKMTSSIIATRLVTNIPKLSCGYGSRWVQAHRERRRPERPRSKLSAHSRQWCPRHVVDLTAFAHPARPNITTAWLRIESSRPL